MSQRHQHLTVPALIELVSIDGLYNLSYAFLFGMSVWVNFFGGVIAYRALRKYPPPPHNALFNAMWPARQQFGALQHRVFPVFFTTSQVISSILLVLWTLSHPDVVPNWHKPLLADVAQAWSLATVLLTQGTNDWVVGPLTSKTMFERQKLEKEEGKNSHDAGVRHAFPLSFSIKIELFQGV